MGLSFNQRRSFVREADIATPDSSTLCVDAADLTDVAEALMSQRKRRRARAVSWSEAATTVEAEADEQTDSEWASSGHYLEAAVSAVSVDVTMVPVRTSGHDVRCFAGGEQEWTVRAQGRTWRISSGNARTFGTEEEHFFLAT